MIKEHYFHRMIPLLGALCLIAAIPMASAQEMTFADSLIRVLPASADDTNKVIILNDLGWELKFDDPERAVFYLDSALRLARRLDFVRGEGDAYNYRGVVEDIHGNYEKAIFYFQQSQERRETLNDQKKIASLYNNIGNARENLGEYAEALDSYLKSLRILEELNDSARVARQNYNISILYESMGENDEALSYILDYLDFARRTNDREELAKGYNVIGNIKMEMGLFEEAQDYYEQALTIHQALDNQWEEASVLNNLGNSKDARGLEMADSKRYSEARALSEEALDYYEKALRIRNELDDTDGKGEIFNNIGLSHKNRGLYFQNVGLFPRAEESWAEALDYLEQALDIWKEQGNKKGQLEIYKGISDVYRAQENFAESLAYTEQYLSLAEEIGDEKFIQIAYEDLSIDYSSLGDFEKAFNFRQKYDELLNERLNEEVIRVNAQKEVLYSDRQKQYEIESQRNRLRAQEAELERATILQYSLIGGSIGLLLMILLIYNRYRIKNKANRELAEKNAIIKKEQERSDKLLKNILPEATAEELKEHGKAKAQRYNSVSVLFTDFKSFTQVAESLSPEELVAELDYCFREFDEITTRLGIEKIKTIGDSYMCACGLPEPNKKHAELVVQAGLEMLAFMKKYQTEKKANNQPYFEMRVGIHTGPVVAGIVGNKKFAYDVWGDTVNMAARMESSGEPGKVNISETTYNKVKKKFICTPRGKIKAKNKGEQEMYFVEGSYADEKRKISATV
jgi:adenylate cyclase